MKRRRIRLGALGAAAGLLVSAAVSIAPASAAPAVTCGTVITADTTLRGDVGPCPGNGIIVGADNITLNLNGYKVLGNSSRTGNFAGVRLPNRTGVTVLGGKLDRLGRPVAAVSGFDAGVLINGGSGNSVRNVVVQDNLGAATNASFLGDGIIVMNSAANTIQRNTVDHNGIYDGIAVLGDASNSNKIRDNTISRTVALISETENATGTGVGIIMNGFFEVPTGKLIRGNQILDNAVRQNDGSGISNINLADGRVAGNTIEDNGHVQIPGNGIGLNLGMQPESTIGHMVIESNVIRRNGGFGIQSQRTDANQFLSNTVEENGFDPPFGVPVADRAIGISSDVGGNLIKGNTVRRNNYSGIFFSAVDDAVPGRSDNNRIEANTVTDNAGIVGLVFFYNGVPEGPNAWNNFVVSNYVVNTAGFADLADASLFLPPQDCRGALWDNNTYEVAVPPCTGNGGTQVSVDPNAPVPGPGGGFGPPEKEPGPPAETPVRRGQVS